MASGHISRAILFSATVVQGCLKDVKVSMQGLQLYGSAGLCSPGQSIFVWPKMIALSWPKFVRPFADRSDVDTRGLFTGVLSNSSVPDLLRLLRSSKIY